MGSSFVPQSPRVVAPKSLQSGGGQREWAKDTASLLAAAGLETRVKRVGGGYGEKPYTSMELLQVAASLGNQLRLATGRIRELEGELQNSFDTTDLQMRAEEAERWRRELEEVASERDAMLDQLAGAEEREAKLVLEAKALRRIAEQALIAEKKSYSLASPHARPPPDVRGTGKDDEKDSSSTGGSAGRRSSLISRDVTMKVKEEHKEQRMELKRQSTSPSLLQSSRPVAANPIIVGMSALGGGGATPRAFVDEGAASSSSGGRRRSSPLARLSTSSLDMQLDLSESEPFAAPPAAEDDDAASTDTPSPEIANGGGGGGGGGAGGGTIFEKAKAMRRQSMEGTRRQSTSNGLATPTTPAATAVDNEILELRDQLKVDMGAYERLKRMKEKRDQNSS